MQQSQYTPMKKMEVDLRPLDAEEETPAGQDGRSIHLSCIMYLTYSPDVRGLGSAVE